MSGRINWLEIMRAGLHGLGLKPAEFWALTPLELMLMLGDRQAVQPIGRVGLDSLIMAFPDEHGDREDGRV